jgi:hypothetical protein
MFIKVTVKSDRKKMRRRFRSARALDRYLKMDLPRKTKLVVKGEVQRRLDRNSVSQGRTTRVKVTISPVKGWIQVHTELPLPDPGAIDPASIWAMSQESWMSGETVVMEIPSGFLYEVSDALKDKAREAQEIQKSKNRGAVVQIQAALHESVLKVVQRSKPYRRQVRKVLDKVVKDLSLADV